MLFYAACGQNASDRAAAPLRRMSPPEAASRAHLFPAQLSSLPQNCGSPPAGRPKARQTPNRNAACRDAELAPARVAEPRSSANEFPLLQLHPAVTLPPELQQVHPLPGSTSVPAPSPELRNEARLHPAALASRTASCAGGNADAAFAPAPPYRSS